MLNASFIHQLWLDAYFHKLSPHLWTSNSLGLTMFGQIHKIITYKLISGPTFNYYLVTETCLQKKQEMSNRGMSIRAEWRDTEMFNFSKMLQRSFVALPETVGVQSIQKIITLQ